MANGAVQAGHCFRTSGATGSAGEQHFTDRVSRRAVALLNERGHSAVRVLADGVVYRAWDFFVAVHFDASANSSVRGASVGYLQHQGSRHLAAEWKRAYGRYWPYSFRADNYTSALAGYYGNRLAVNAGTKAAIICEFGFGTNSTERKWMEANVELCARSISDAVGTVFGHPRTGDWLAMATEDDVRKVIREELGRHAWLRGVMRWIAGDVEESDHVPSMVRRVVREEVAKVQAGNVTVNVNEAAIAKAVADELKRRL